MSRIESTKEAGKKATNTKFDEDWEAYKVHLREY